MLLLKHDLGNFLRSEGMLSHINIIITPHLEKHIFCKK